MREVIPVLKRMMWCLLLAVMLTTALAGWALAGPTLIAGGKVNSATDGTTADGGKWSVYRLADPSRVVSGTNGQFRPGYWSGEIGAGLEDIRVGDTLVAVIQKETGSGTANSKGYYAVIDYPVANYDPAMFAMTTLREIPVPSVAINGATATLTWSAAAEDSATANIAGYNVFRSSNGIAFTRINTSTVTATTFTDNAAPPGSSYRLGMVFRGSPSFSGSGPNETVSPTSAPTVSAGPNLKKSAPFTLTGSASDSLPLTYTWSQASGMGRAIFSSPNSLSTQVKVMAAFSGTYVLRLTATNSAGISSYSDMTLLWENDTLTMPYIAKVLPNNTYTVGSTVSYTLTYDGASAITLAAADVTLNKTGTADGTVTISGSGNTIRTLTIANITGSGTIGFTIAAGTARNQQGNLAPEFTLAAPFTVKDFTPSLTGTVTDLSSGMPISGATVSLLHGPVTDTGADGSYRFIGLSPGTYYATITVSGYYPTTAGNLLVVTGTPLQANISLQPYDRRFIDNAEGSMADTQTGLTWLKNANCFNLKNWSEAMSLSSALADGQCGLKDSTRPGDWHLPTFDELRTFVDSGLVGSSLLSAGFINVQSNSKYYWSSTPSTTEPATMAMAVDMDSTTRYHGLYSNTHWVWPARTGLNWKFDNLVISAARTDLGTWAAGTTSTPLYLTIRNSGSEPITVAAMTMTGSDGSQFTVSPGGSTPCVNLTPTMAAGAACTVGVTVTPNSTQQKTGILAITSGAQTYYLPLSANNIPGISATATSTTPEGFYTTGDAINISLAFSGPVTSPGFTIYLNSGASINTGPLDNATSWMGTYTIGPEENATSLNITGINGDGTAVPQISLGQNLADKYKYNIDTSPPVVSAGPNQRKYSQFTQTGAVSDASPVKVIWKQISGPGTVTFGNYLSANTTISANADGVYTLRLYAQDVVANRSYSDMTLVWGNASPLVVSAGPSRYARALFTQTATAGGISPMAYAWSKVSGPGTITFGSPNALATTVSANAEGVYVLSFSAIDAEGNSSASTMQLVWDTTPPVVSAGTNKTTSILQLFTQTATASDSSPMTYAWSKVSGPNSIAFGSPTSLSTTISIGTEGAYVLRFTATDAAGNSSSSDMTLTWDITPPTIAIGPPSATINNIGPVIYTVTYGGADAVNLSKGHVSLTKTGTANASVAVSGSGTTTRTVTLSGITGNGTLRISIAGGTASDAAGNTAPGAGPSATFTVDNTAPVISNVSPATGSFINLGQAGYTLSESVASGSITFTRTGGTDDPSSPRNYNLTAPDMTAGSHTIQNLTLQNGTVYTVTFNAADAAGNVATPITTTNVTYDTTGATVTLTSPAAGSKTNNATVAYTLSETIGSGTIIFTHSGGSEDGASPHSYVLAGDELAAGSHIVNTGLPLVDGAVYSVAISNVFDSAGNTSPVVSSDSVIYDTSAVAITNMSPVAGGALNKSAVVYTLSETAQSGKITFTRSGGALDNAAPHLFILSGDDLVFGPHSVVTNLPLVNGAIYTLSIEATDLAGNPATTVSVANVNFDTVAPILTLGTPSATLTSNANVTYTVTYEGADDVTLANSDITLNSTGTANGTVSVSGSGKTSRTVTLSGITGNGTLGISIAAGSASDSAGNTALASGPGATFMVDNTAPVISNVSPAAGGFINLGRASYALSEDVAGGAITFSRTGGADDPGSPRAYTFTPPDLTTGSHTIQNLQLQNGTVYTITFNATDAAGNSATPVSVNGVTYDTSAPTLTISAPSVATTYNDDVTYTVTYNGADSISLTDTEITLNKTGTANGIVTVTGTGNTRSVTISSISGGGTLGISIAANTASDMAGNYSLASGPSATFTVNIIRTLSVTVSGSGSVNSLPSGVACTGSGAGCTVQFNSGTGISLMATESAASHFVGWGGACSGHSLHCLFTLWNDSAATATFSLISPVQLLTANATTSYPTLTEAYNAAPTGSAVTMKAMSGDFEESLLLDRNVNVTLNGGQSSSFNGTSGLSILHGRLNIRGGRLVPKNLRIW